ncbi:MAG: hypothetical protein SR1Q7_01460 [Quinella sp. 1Q7]|nr:hypothetical protein [Quinella sp. 1Q7]
MTDTKKFDGELLSDEQLDGVRGGTNLSVAIVAFEQALSTQQPNFDLYTSVATNNYTAQKNYRNP